MHVRVMVLVLVHLSAQVRWRCHAHSAVLRSQETVVKLSAKHVGIWIRVFLFNKKTFRPKLDRPDRAAPRNSLDLLDWNRLSAENGFGLAVVGAADDKGLAVETGGGARGGGANSG